VVCVWFRRIFPFSFSGEWLVPGLGDRSRGFLARLFTALVRLRCLIEVVRLVGFDQRRGKSSERFFRGWRRRRSQSKDQASSGCSLDRSPRLRGSTLRNKVKRPFPLLLRAGSLVFVRCL
jgi:hypothetical protein